MDRRTTLARYMPRAARLAVVGATALTLGLVDQVISYTSNSNSSVAMASETTCNQPRVSALTENCQREVRIAYLAGAHKPGEAITASLTDRTADIVIDGMNPVKVKVGPLNNSGVAFEESAASFRRSMVIRGLTLNYIAVPVGQTDLVNVSIHRLNTDGSRRADQSSNPPASMVDTCVIDENNQVALNTIQVYTQDSELGDKPSQYRNLNNDLVFQNQDMLFQGTDLSYLLTR